MMDQSVNEGLWVGGVSILFDKSRLLEDIQKLMILLYDIDEFFLRYFPIRIFIQFSKQFLSFKFILSFVVFSHHLVNSNQCPDKVGLKLKFIQLQGVQKLNWYQVIKQKIQHFFHFLTLGPSSPSQQETKILIFVIILKLILFWILGHPNTTQ